MTQEDKELLIKDLCGRLPYGVKVRHEHLGKIGILYEISMCGNLTIDYGIYNHFCNINDTKPYLFPISSMSEEQRNEYHKLLYNPKDGIDIDYFDWCHKNHLDCRGLIKKGLAIDCTNLNIY